MLYFYYLNPHIQISNEEMDLSSLLDELNNRFEINYEKVDVLQSLVKNQIDAIAQNQGLILPKLDIPFDENIVVIYELDQYKNPKVITFYPQRPVNENDTTSLSEITTSNFLYGLFIQVILISSLNLQRDLIFKKISELQRKTLNSNFIWHLLNY